MTDSERRSVLAALDRMTCNARLDVKITDDDELASALIAAHGFNANTTLTGDGRSIAQRSPAFREGMATLLAERFSGTPRTDAAHLDRGVERRALGGDAVMRADHEARIVDGDARLDHAIRQRVASRPANMTEAQAERVARRDIARENMRKGGR